LYKFKDTISAASDVALLPSEALRINGQYIENQIAGYRTLSVSGREALSPELETYSTGNRDGATLKNKRYPERVITVKYRLLADSPEAFREAYTKLGYILDVEEAELIFNDEADKFFIGTPCAIGEVDPGRNAVVGEFEILCVDPFKYSVTEYEALPQNTSTGKAFVIDYNGTYKAFPKIESKFFSQLENGSTATTLTDDGDCGFVALYNDEGRILQFGDTEELDGTAYEASQTLINQTFASDTSWGTTAKSLWAVNSGLALKHEEKQVGNVAMHNFSSTLNDWCLIPSDYGSGATRCGPSITRNIGTDGSGETGAKDWQLTYKQRLNPAAGVDALKEVGGFYCAIVAGSGANRKMVAGVRIARHSVGDTNGKLNLYVNDKQVAEMPINLSPTNKYFSALGNRVTTIRKQGNNVVFNVAGVRKSYNCYDDGFAETKATQVTFEFFRYSAYTPISFNGLYYAKFTKNNCDTFKEIPNKFSADDVLTADCSSGEILVNGLVAPEYGALGNDWENFYLKPGYNMIGLSYSNWLTDAYAPTVKLKYREVFL
jgi:predicted phage tail component-like protein